MACRESTRHAPRPMPALPLELPLAVHASPALLEPTSSSSAALAPFPSILLGELKLFPLFQYLLSEAVLPFPLLRSSCLLHLYLIPFYASHPGERLERLYGKEGAPLIALQSFMQTSNKGTALQAKYCCREENFAARRHCSGCLGAVQL